MKNSLLLLFIFLCTFTGFSQSYSYSFEGVLDSEELSSLQEKCQGIPYVETCKVQYKVEKGGGEIKFRVTSAEDRPEASEQFSPIDMKRVLIEAKLMPLDFIQLYD
jgi:hypothetical protein